MPVFRGEYDDPLNFRGKRNFNNVEPRLYNCGGFALKTFNWYCPVSSYSDEYRSFTSNVYDILNNSNDPLNRDVRYELLSNADDFIDICVHNMITEFNGRLREIESKRDSKLNELVICFRVETKGMTDFHFMQYRSVSDSWAHKRGAMTEIETLKDKYINTFWADRYDSRITYLALRTGV